MAPIVILVVVTLVLAGAGAAGVPWLRPWQVALRGGVAAMFTATGVAHFVGLREQMISMVPPALPAPGLLVTLTGILELAGAAGVLWPRTTKWAAAGLSAMLVLMFPANVHAAVDHVLTAWHDQLVPRTLMQVVFLAATLTVSGHARRSRTAEPVRPLAQ
ncbi:DoxX family protein [Amycolatopsis thermophila]|uniref:Membrane protein n=1 Tax=Amycolatopsis thermophila TaxID=206084 RepID=A0ABU0ETM1_9PSEU|nr:DoxX family protein [Amycolatopsis thermophila]MDQ0378489.1 putative membrane protein [Amycolatopsis thermophila]